MNNLSRLYLIVSILFTIFLSTNSTIAQNTLNLAGLSASSPATVAYSLRRLSSTYSGNLIQVRRSSDNTTSNIGFDGSGHLDTNALKTFVGAGNGFVSIWYDQSGNANNAVQSTNGSQPQIVNAGVILRSNSRPTVRFDGSTFIDGGSSGYSITNARTLSAVYNLQSGSPSHIIDRSVAGNPVFSIKGDNQAQLRNDAGTLIFGGGTSQSAPFTNTLTLIWDGSNNINMFKNSVSDYSSSLSLPSSMDIMRIGRHFSSTSTCELNMWEVILFPSAISSGERQAMECNQQVYYSSVTIAGSRVLTTAIPTTLSANIAGGTWSSGNTGVAIVNSSTGRVTGVSAGTAMISYNTAAGCAIPTTITVSTPANALHFNGTDDIVTVANNSSLNISGNITIEAWINVSSTVNGTQNVISKSNNVNNNAYIFPRTDDNWNGIIGYLHIGGSWRTLSAAYPSPAVGTWHHCAITYNGSLVTLYIDGVVANTLAVSGALTTNTNALVMGSQPGYGEFFTGALDEARIWNVARTQAQIQADMNNDVAQQSGLVAYYRFNQGITNGTNTGLTAITDFSGNENCGTASGFSLSGATSNFVAGAIGSYTNLNVVGQITGNNTLSTAITTTLGNSVSGGTWSSSNTGVATVGSITGIVTGVSAGTSIVTYTKCGFSATTVVTVNTPATGIHFDGTNDYISNTTGTNLPTGNSQYTIEAWIKPTSGVGGIAGWGNYGTNNQVTAFRLDGTNKLHNYWWFNDLTATVPSLTDGKWHHVAATFNGTTRSIYCDGVLYAQDNPTGHNVTVSNNLTIGRTWTAEYFPGSIDEVKIWNTGRTASQIIADMNCDVAQNPNLVVYYRFNEGIADGSNSANTIAADYSGNYNCGTLNGFALTGATSNYVTGAVGSCNNLILVNSITGTLSVCSGSTTTLSSTTPGGVWSSSNTAVATVAAGVVTGVAGGTATISYSRCGVTVTAVVTVTPAPTVTSVTPLLGFPASSVSIVGSNFDATTSNNIVYFGATKATVSAANTTTLNVTVPSGATFAPLTVLTTGCGFTVSSPMPYLPYYNNAAYVPATTNFKTRFTKSAGSTPMYLALGDIDGDGKTDIVTSNESANTVNVLRNVSSGGTMSSSSFSAEVGFATGNSPRFIRLGDIDGDGKLDIVVSNGTSSSISVFRNTSSIGSITSGSFAAKVDFTLAGVPANIAIADLDADGKQDISVCNNGTTISVFKNTSSPGSISMATRADFTAGNSNVGLTAADLDGDGKIDLACSNNFASSASGITVLRNTTSGTISFASGVTFAGPWSEIDVITLDIDGDGKLDLAAVGQNGLTVWQNTATSGVINSGSFASRVDYPGLANTRTIASGDFDGDGRPDLVTTYYLADDTRVYRNLTTGSGSTITTSSFASYIAFPNVNQTGLAVGDLDGDGKADIVTGHNLISVLQNDPLQPITGTTQVCAGNTTTLANATTGGTWSSSNAAIATVGSLSGVVTGVSGGTVTITYAGTAGASFAGNRVTTVVTVHPMPTTFTGNAVLSTSITTTLSNAIAGGTWSSSNVSVATIGSSTGVVTGVAAGTSFITYTTAQSCFSTTIVTVNTPANALHFNGSDDVVTIPNNAALNISSNITIEAWINVSSTVNASQNVICKSNNINNNGYVFPRTDNNWLSVFAYLHIAGNWEILTAPYPTPAVGTWHHCALTYDGSLVTIYVDGQIGNTLAVSGPLTVNNNALTMGNQAGYSEYFTGSLDEARIWNIARTQAQIQADMNKDIAQNPNLVAYYKFNEGTAAGTNTGLTNLTDFSGNANCGTLSGFALSGSTSNYVVGAVGNANTLNVVSPITGTLTVCQAQTSTLSSNTPAGVWSSSNTGVATVAAGVVTGVATGTSTISYTKCGVTVTAVVTVNPSPSYTLGVNRTICAATPTSLIAMQSPAGNAITFPGSGNNYISIPSATSNRLSTSNFSVSTWIRPASTAHQVILFHGFGCSTWSSWFLGIGGSENLVNSGKIVFGFRTSNGSSSFEVVSPSDVTINAWTHVFATYDGSNLRLYLNGSLVATAAASGTPYSNGDNLSLGIDPGCGGRYHYSGSLDDLQLWNTTRSATDIANYYNQHVAAASTGIVGSWAFDEASGSSISDSSTSANNASIVGTLSRMAPTTAPIFGVPTSSFVWSPSVSLSASTGTSVIATPTVTTTYTVTGTGANSCVNNATITVSVNPLPTVSAGSNVAICSTFSTNLTATGAVNYTWSPATNLSATTGATVTADPTSTITYTVSGTDGNGCVNTASKTVSVNPLPTAFSFSSATCAGNTSTLSSLPSGGTWSSSNTGIATIGLNTGILNNVATGTANITYQLPVTGCYRVSVVTVNPIPAAISVPPLLCPTESATLTSASPDGTWSSANSTVVSVNATTGEITGVVNNYTSNSITFINYTLPTGCVTSRMVTVKPVPAPIYGGNTALCLGETTTLLSGTAGHTWSSIAPGVATVGPSGVVSSVSAGTTTISYTNSVGCATTKVVTVNGPLPVNTGTLSVCTGQSTMLANATAGGTWSTSNASIATVNSLTGLVSGVNGGTVNISYRIGATCFSVSQVTVNSNVAVIGGTKTACVGTETTLTYPVSGGTWSSATPSVATIDLNSGVVSGVGLGTTEITYTVAAGCFKTTVVTVTALPASITGTALLCQAATTSLSSGSGTWSSSNTGIATVNGSGVVTGVSAGNAHITFRATSTGCYVTREVTINPLPAIVSASVCPAQTATLTATPSGGTWSISNPSVATINAATGELTGVIVNNTGISVAIVTNTLATGCSRTAVVTVNPVPSVITGGIRSICIGSTTTLSSSTSGAVWSSTNTGVATISPVGLVTGIGSGTSTISYTNSFGCVATAGMTVSALPVVTPITGTQTVCMSATTTLASTPGGGTWSSSNTIRATVNSSGVVSGINPGTVRITYTAGSGCTAFQTALVTVNPLPGVTPIMGSLTVCEQATSALSAISVGGVWSSSVPAVGSISSGGVVSGITAGNTTISYTLTNVYGCQGRSTAVVTVNPSPVVAAITGTFSVCKDATTALSSVTAGGVWTSSTPSVATVGGTGIVTGVNAGTSTISYTVTNGFGCVTRVTGVVTVNPVPVVSNVSGIYTVCENAQLILSASLPLGTWTSSNTGVANIDTFAGVITPVAVGTSLMSYQVVATGCMGTREITVIEAPTAIGGVTAMCPGATATLTSTPGGGTWTAFNSGVISINATTGAITAVIVDHFGISVTAITYTIPNGCARVVYPTVNPIPAPIYGGVYSLCVGETTTLLSGSLGHTWSSDNTGIATVSGGGVVTAQGAGVATISYTHSSGCATTKTITVNAALSPNVGSSSMCTGTTTLFSNALPGGTWTSSDISKATVHLTSGLVSASNAGTATLSYRVPSGCYVTNVITVNTTPSTITGTRSVCIGATTTLGSTPSGGTWSSSADGIASVGSSSGIVTGVSDGTATVTYTSAAGCIRTAVVTVNTLPAAITGAGVACAGGGTTALTNVSGTWSSSNTGIATVNYLGTVTGVSGGNAIITFRNANNCATTKEVTINPLPSPIVVPTGLCLGSTGTFTATPSGGTWASANPAVFSVDGVSGAMTALIANYTSNSVGTVSYTLPTGCVRTGIVTVNRQPGNIYGGTGKVCTGATTAQFSSTTGCTWSSATPSVATISPTGVVTGVSAGNTVISYTSAAGCAAQRVITVDATPDVITGSSTVLVGQTTTLANTTVGGTWSSSVTSRATIGSASGVVTGMSTGTTNITYMMSTGCFVTRAMNVAAARGVDETVKEVVVTEVKLYPNPTTGIFTVSTPIAGTISVYTIDGRALLEQKVTTGISSITLPNNIAAGFYTCTFTGTDGGTTIIRLVYEPK